MQRIGILVKIVSKVVDTLLKWYMIDKNNKISICFFTENEILYYGYIIFFGSL